MRVAILSLEISGAAVSAIKDVDLSACKKFRGRAADKIDITQDWLCGPKLSEFQGR
jgi:hypothetical protein